MLKDAPWTGRWVSHDWFDYAGIVNYHSSISRSDTEKMVLPQHSKVGGVGDPSTRGDLPQVPTAYSKSWECWEMLGRRLQSPSSSHVHCLSVHFFRWAAAFFQTDSRQHLVARSINHSYTQPGKIKTKAVFAVFFILSPWATQGRRDSKWKGASGEAKGVRVVW